MLGRLKSVIHSIAGSSDHADVKTIPAVQAKKHGFSGDYDSWESALLDSTGYDSPDILENVRSAMLKVQSGEAICERDAYLFDEIQYSWPLLAGLLRVAAINKNRLSVLDFGGSLGTSYYQNRMFLSVLDFLSWNIVEQKHFVDAGKSEFENDELSFYYSIDECLAQKHIDIAVVSGVLQCVREPHELLNHITDSGLDYIIVDRTPFMKNTNRDILTVQTAPPRLYAASFPHWFFERDHFLSHFQDHGYRLVAEFKGFDKVDVPDVDFLGFIFQKIKA